jgi:hypothetical protein
MEGSRPEAPGLIWRGGKTPVWRCSAAAKRAGYPVKWVNLDRARPWSQFGETIKPGAFKILDIDDTFCATHGAQQLASWSGPHDERSFASMHIYRQGACNFSTPRITPLCRTHQKGTSSLNFSKTMSFILPLNVFPNWLMAPGAQSSFSTALGFALSRTAQSALPRRSS